MRNIFKRNVKRNFMLFNNLYIENLYKDYLDDTYSVPNAWREKFLKINKKIKKKIKIKNKKIKNFFRLYGYQIAKTNPLKLINKNIYEFKNIKEEYLKLKNKKKKLNIKETNKIKVFKKFKKIYCNFTGFEFRHLLNYKEKKWIQKEAEKKMYKIFFSVKKKKKLLKEVLKAELFEKNLSIKFPGTKRFSLEGAEIFIPILKNIINFAKKKKKKKIIIGMAHRGRLNVLINVLKKNILKLFYEFSKKYKNPFYSDDVKYHKGMDYIIKYKNDKTLIVSLLNNPSHLEIINPVVIGTARAYIDSVKTEHKNKILPIVIHGDAAICGQGVVQETLNISQTRGYKVGGTINIVINNQIGFTTSNKKDLRSSKFCTDISKMIDSPIFHINADNVESAISTIKIALKFREIYKKDIFINLICYRRYGHNEIDDPYITQPVLYKQIYKHPKISKIYRNTLISEGIINSKYISKIKKKYNNKFNEKYIFFNKNFKKEVLLDVFKSKKKKKMKIKIKKKDLKKLILNINKIPDNLNIHPIVKKMYLLRKKMASGEILLDWGAVENLAYATLLKKGFSCRLTGEDVERGTFSHRNCVIYDQNTEKKYIPLKKISNIKGNFYVWNSTLSELATLAFEYGYSKIKKEDTLTVWEAQFGDFINGAQIVIDQFISSGEQKWNQSCNLVILLPHGYEGQGPEHSSARIERFLQLCSENNMKVSIPSNPSQLYHLLCEQMFRKILKPLIIFSPKSLLRHPLAKSKLKDLYKKSFLKVITESKKISNKLIKRVVFCSGKIYYDLLIKRRNKNIINIALIRIEQLYPFPKKEIQKILKIYKSVQDVVWCQEEPYNQGPWSYIYQKLQKILSPNVILNYIGRKSSSSTAVGSVFMHQLQQKKIINQALNLVKVKNEYS